MKAVLFQRRRGDIVVEDVPAPQLGPGRVLIRNQFSLISAATEKATLHASQQGLIGKARERPDQARQVLQALRQVGPYETYRMVNDRLGAPSVLGYSCAGTVEEVGQGVDGLAPGGRVAAGGGGYACHAEVVAVPKNLCVPVPDGVPSRLAAFATLGAIALQGIHQAETQPGSRVAVIGLGLVGQLTIRILAAYGYDVVGIDRDETMVALARAVGVTALARDADDLVAAVRRRWRGSGADAVLVTAATKSTDPVELAGQLARDRAAVVIVGDVNVAPPRSSYYGKELSLRYSRSYGPGRYDPRYEEGGVDYPEGYAPWPLRRNMEELLRLVGQGLDLESLQPVVFPADEAPAAYAALDATGKDRRVAILLSYSAATPLGEDSPAEADAMPAGGRRRRNGTTVLVAAVGAGSFPTRMLFPHLKRHRQVELAWLTTGRGFTAPFQCRQWGFDQAVSGLAEGLALDAADCVMVLDRHGQHARHAATVLNAGVGLFCEKPLALDEDELESVAESWVAGGAPAMVGFNRRFSPAVRRLKQALGSRGPLQVVYRVFAGRLAPDHWVLDPEHGGRVVGEVCHFVDTATFLTGSLPTSVVASAGDGDDDPVRTQSASVHIGYRDGSTASILYGGRTPSGAPKEHIEVAADGLAARIDDFRSLTLWTGRTERITFKGGPKGHAQEMAALVELLLGTPPPETDFPASLWSTLATCRVAASIHQRRLLPVQPATPALAKVLGTDLAAVSHEADTG